MKWKTREGKIMDIKDMSDKHVQNSIKMLQREVSELENEAIAHDEYGFNFSYHSVMEIIEDTEQQIKNLQKELNRRYATHSPVIW